MRTHDERTHDERMLLMMGPHPAAPHPETVRAFGTEGRLGGVNEIPGSPDVYPFIEFRGSDIKDLRVIGAASAPGPPADPAIISVRFPQQGVRERAAADV